MNRMHALDALFLHAEDGTTHMHIGSCATFGGPAPSMDELTALVAGKLHLVPRFRQKVRFVPGDLGAPVWVDDAHFDLADHLRHATLPPRSGQRALEAFMADLMSDELGRGRPLWEMWLVDGLSRGRWALISKVHHCMVDGISGTDIMMAILDVAADAPIGAPPPWTPRREPGGVRLTVDALTGLATVPAQHALSLLRGVKDPRSAWDSVRGTLAGLRSYASRVVAPVAPLSIEGSIGGRRRWAVGRCTLADVKAIRQARGGSVNDVVLAAITSAFRDVLMRRGDVVEGATVTSLVPVSVRTNGDRSMDNQVSMMFVELPVGIADPLDRFDAVRASMATLKASHQAHAGVAVWGAADVMPPALFALMIRGATSIMRRTPQHIVHTVTTNVPGPSVPLYALGREMLEYLPFVPLSQGVRIGVAILSYHGNLAFGITGDYESAPDVVTMAKAIESAIFELQQLTTSRGASST